jgi:hypothetical protein
VVRRAFSEHRAGAPGDAPARGRGPVAARRGSVRSVIFQRYVPADLNLRVPIVEDEIFARQCNRTNSMRPTTAPVSRRRVWCRTRFLRRCTELPTLMQALDLKFGAIELRVTPDGDHVFLEVNPAGEYLFISRRTEQPISAAIAASLERHDRDRTKDCGPC